MQLSVFDVLGPVMIGPSSSHTAGAARLAAVAAIIANKPFHKVHFGMSGSFAKTGKGHGTDKALLAGALGLGTDDERIRDVDRLAKERKVTVEYEQEDLEDQHENSVHIVFYHEDGSTSEIWGSSIGGGRIIITRIGEFDTEISAESPTLVVQHKDRPGVVSEVTRLLAEKGINIAVMRLARRQKGGIASVVIEVDGTIPQQVVTELKSISNVLEVISVDVP